MKWKDRQSEWSDSGLLDDETELALRSGLRAQPVPAASPGFDARVLSAVHGRSPFWELFYSALRPALATAAVSTVVTTLILSSHVGTANPALAASPPADKHPATATGTRTAKTLAPEHARVKKALSDGEFLSMNAWRPAPPPERASESRHAGG